jgi:regulatory protein
MTFKKPKQSVDECAMGLLARREHSVAELRRKLREKGYEAAQVAECMEKLEGRGHVSDARYAAARARYRAVGSKWGWLRIQLELKANGVGEEEIAKAKAALEEEGVDFTEQAEHIVARMQGKDREKVGSLLRRKGYTGEQIRNSLDQLSSVKGIEGFDED